MNKYYGIAELIRMDIFSKYGKANQLIPSIRSYAKAYHVNSNTVCRALQLLEAEEIIYPYRTKGYYISEDIQNKKEIFRKKQAKRLVNILHELGYSNVEIEDMLKTIIKK
ncbi:GntR family transcriptional regulator [[Ruminococcus] torques]|uniref:GntR family transcriptional regulator n=1 Tax=[Ruminococcus] torques TaxID=33039 RepID=UPI00243118DC|nr:GntR family transcriptional regulator [[Ruminococcus] torques]